MNTTSKPPLPPTPIFEAADLGRAIRARRKQLGYTQAHVAAIMGVSPRLIGEIERGRQTVGIQKVLDLATGLGLDLTLTGRGAR